MGCPGKYDECDSGVQSGLNPIVQSHGWQMIRRPGNLVRVRHRHAVQKQQSREAPRAWIHLAEGSAVAGRQYRRESPSVMGRSVRGRV